MKKITVDEFGFVNGQRNNMIERVVDELGYVRGTGFFELTVGLSNTVDDYIEYRYGDLRWGINLDEVYTRMAHRLPLVLTYFSINTL